MADLIQLIHLQEFQISVREKPYRAFNLNDLSTKTFIMVIRCCCEYVSVTCLFQPMAFNCPQFHPLVNSWLFAVIGSEANICRLYLSLKT